VAKIYDSILEAIGNTPLVRLRKIGKKTGCEFLAKCEYTSPGGSVKDRIAKRMVEEAQKSGRIKPGDTLIEPTSGNTGIGMALASAVYGYRCMITMPEKMSREKQVVLEALGAEIIRTPTEAAWDSPESREFDVFVSSAGTGGTIAGAAKRLKEAMPNVHVVGVDPVGSILAGPGPIQSYKVEGIGYDFIPDVLDRSLVDEWVKCEDRESFQMARRLIRQEGLLCGGSSGSAIWAALQVARRIGPGKRFVIILPDSVRNYMTKFLDDQWMRESGFTETRWETNDLASVLQSMPPRTLHTTTSSALVADAVMLMKEKGVSQLPVIDSDKLVGIVTESDLLGRLVEGNANLSSAVAEVMFRNVRTVHGQDDAGALTGLFQEGLTGLVVDDDSRLLGILTKMDLVDYLTKPLESPASA